MFIHLSEILKLKIKRKVRNEMTIIDHQSEFFTGHAQIFWSRNTRNNLLNSRFTKINTANHESRKYLCTTLVFFLLIMRARLCAPGVHVQNRWTVYQILIKWDFKKKKKKKKTERKGIWEHVSQHWNPLSHFEFDCKSKIRNSQSNAPYPYWVFKDGNRHLLGSQ